MSFDRVLVVAAIFMAIGVFLGIKDGAWAQTAVGLAGIAVACSLLLWRRQKA